MRLGDRPVRGLMTPRTDVDWIDLSVDANTIRERVLGTTHSRLPVGDGGPDTIIGVVTTRELLAALLSGKPLDVKTHVRQAVVIPDRMDALDALELLQDTDVPMALIHDEYGHFEVRFVASGQSFVGAVQDEVAGQARLTVVHNTVVAMNSVSTTNAAPPPASVSWSFAHPPIKPASAGRPDRARSLTEVHSAQGFLQLAQFFGGGAALRLASAFEPSLPQPRSMSGDAGTST